MASSGPSSSSASAAAAVWFAAPSSAFGAYVHHAHASNRRTKMGGTGPICVGCERLVSKKGGILLMCSKVKRLVQFEMGWHS